MRDIITKASTLLEALPYIQRFQGQTFVVKLSGKVTEVQENLISLAEELALLHQVGIRICVIHGGGKQLSELAKKLGIENVPAIATLDLQLCSMLSFASVDSRANRFRGRRLGIH